MSEREKRRHSLASRIFRSTATGCILHGLVVLIIGLLLYSLALSGQYVRHAYDTAFAARRSAVHGADAVSVSEEVMDIYYGLSEKQRQLNGTPEYRAFFSSLDTSEDSDYSVLKYILNSFTITDDVDFVYMGMYDEANSALVYIVDLGGDVHSPGEWESVPASEVRTFLDWDGTGMLYNIGPTDDYGWMCTAGYPIKNDAGETVSFVLADVTETKLVHGMQAYALQIVIASLVITALVAWYLSRHMKKTIADPVNEIAEAAKRYAENHLAGEKGTKHFAGLQIDTRDEVENLARTMAEMEEELSSYEEDLTRITAEKERINTELALAGRIQTAMMPQSFPERKEFELYASVSPARGVGGDFYDFFQTDDDHLCLIMADVSGKGIPAALFMMATKIILQSCAMLGRSPEEILQKTNEAILSRNPEEMFITVWLGILEISTGRLTAASAGHEYPILKTPGGGFEVFKDKHGLVLGGMADAEYESYTLQLERGSKLFLYTDGLPESTDTNNEMFGLDRTQATLNEAACLHPKDILENVNRAVDAFVGDAEQFDDLTMMCIQYNGPDPEGGDPVKELTIEASVKNIPAVIDFIDGHLEKLGCPVKAKAQIDVAVDELVNNVASYAYAPRTGELTIRFEFDTDSRSALITFIDSGMPFDPMQLKDPDVTLAAEERGVGGLGIFLVKKTMDEIRYRYENGKNMLQIVKRI
ncbi:MAG: SpoIIE family protein phosphatase [Oscillospiraceae bacterium]|nr:SpoIIE family protein phosphatase [Oscillospiraceae bacterium]